MQSAIQTAVLNFEEKNGAKIETKTKIYIQVPTDEPCLQIIDYMNWVVYRAYTKKEARYFEFLKEKVSLIWDIYDFEKYRSGSNFYNKKNEFGIEKISSSFALNNKKGPLGLESN